MEDALSEALTPGPIVGWETAPEIYVDDIVGIAIHQGTVAVTLAANRVEPGKGSNAGTVRAVVGRLVLPFATATELLRQLNAAAHAATLNQANPPSRTEN